MSDRVDATATLREDLMANVPQKNYSSLAIDVAEIKVALRIWQRIAAGLGGFAVVAGLGALGWCYNLGVKVGKLEQADHEHGIDIVAQLQSPASTEQLETNLIAVTAQIETAKVEGKLPDQSKVRPLSSVLSGVLKNNPDMPRAWNAATQLVNYRFQPSGKDLSSLPDCLNLPLMGSRAEVEGPPGPDGIPTHSPPTGPVIVRKLGAMVVAQNCRLDLDDNGEFASSTAARDFEDAKRHKPEINYFVLEVSNAYITYKGGKLIPVNEIRFKNCSFEIRPTFDIPDRRQQEITKQLLEAKNNEGAIRLPVGT